MGDGQQQKMVMDTENGNNQTLRHNMAQANTNASSFT
jgi:hypothetical protein